MLPIQIIILLFLVFAVLKTVSGFKKGRVKIKELISWFVLWTGVAVITILPQTTTFFAHMLGVGQGADLVIYLSIIVLFYIIFRIYMKLEKIESDITRIVREITLKSKR